MQSVPHVLLIVTYGVVDVLIHILSLRAVKLSDMK